MKYYYNKQTNRFLIDENESTSYLKNKGYEQITKEQYEKEHEQIDECELFLKINKIKNKAK